MRRIVKAIIRLIVTGIILAIPSIIVWSYRLVTSTFLFLFLIVGVPMFIYVAVIVLTIIELRRARRFCDRCGVTLYEGSKFCHQCGSKLEIQV